MDLQELQRHCRGNALLGSAWQDVALSALSLCSVENQKGWEVEISGVLRLKNGELKKLRDAFDQKKALFVRMCEGQGFPVPEFSAQDVYDLIAH